MWKFKLAKCVKRFQFANGFLENWNDINKTNYGEQKNQTERKRDW